jgi:hypothetical protein
MVDAGVTSILNFSASVLNLDAEVSVRKVDLAVELQILSFYKRRADGPGTVGPDALAGSDSSPPLPGAPGECAVTGDRDPRGLIDWRRVVSPRDAVLRSNPPVLSADQRTGVWTTIHTRSAFGCPSSPSD